MSDSDEVKKLKEKVDSLEELARKNDVREEKKVKEENFSNNFGAIGLVIFIGLLVFWYCSMDFSMYDD